MQALKGLIWHFNKMSSHPTLERKTKIIPVGNSELIFNDVCKHNCRNSHLNSPVVGPESLWIAYVALQYCRDKPITMHKTNRRRNLNSINQQTNQHHITYEGNGSLLLWQQPLLDFMVGMWLYSGLLRTGFLHLYIHLLQIAQNLRSKVRHEPCFISLLSVTLL